MKRLLILLFALGSLASAEEHRFFDKQNVGWAVAGAAGQTMDAVTTQRFLSRGSGYETNPLARPFEYRGWAGSATLHYGVNSGGTLALAYLLHRTGHHKLERVPQVLNTFSGFAFGTWNLQGWNGQAGRYPRH